MRSRREIAPSRLGGDSHAAGFLHFFSSLFIAQPRPSDYALEAGTEVPGRRDKSSRATSAGS